MDFHELENAVNQQLTDGFIAMNRKLVASLVGEGYDKAVCREASIRRSFNRGYIVTVKYVLIREEVQRLRIPSKKKLVFTSEVDMMGFLTEYFKGE